MSTTKTGSAAAAAAETNQYLTFTLDDECFALNIATVREVLELTRITRVPRTPPFMRGVINLRGHAVPVVDLRLKFGMAQIEDTINTCIIISEVDCGEENAVVGMRVDSVREVLEMDASSVEAAPRIGAAINTDFIRGMARQGDDFVIILDIDRIFSAEELASMSCAGVPEAGVEEA
ncbi:MAG: chemotaxis protein CheW [Desulfovibrionaceae bacterium]|jgi:purine-binding chemotaxis protein CheW|nr:chemotaxis protein CheW [Desulfovibrionaceae bacterium]